MAKQSQMKKGGAKVKPKKKTQRSVPSGVAHVRATFNNTIVCITDPSGNVLTWSTSGKAGYSGSKKSSAYAATVAAQDAAKGAVAMGMKEVEVNLRGPGVGRESAVRGLISAGLMVTVIRDKTPVPHNGCRARKRRRA